MILRSAFPWIALPSPPLRTKSLRPAVKLCCMYVSVQILYLDTYIHTWPAVLCRHRLGAGEDTIRVQKPDMVGQNRVKHGGLCCVSVCVCVQQSAQAHTHSQLPSFQAKAAHQLLKSRHWCWTDVTPLVIMGPDTPADGCVLRCDGSSLVCVFCFQTLRT